VSVFLATSTCGKANAKTLYLRCCCPQMKNACGLKQKNRWTLSPQPTLIHRKENILKVGPALHLFTSQNGSDRTKCHTYRAKAGECQAVALTTRVKLSLSNKQMSKRAQTRVLKQNHQRGKKENLFWSLSRAQLVLMIKISFRCQLKSLRTRKRNRAPGARKREISEISKEPKMMLFSALFSGSPNKRN